MKTLLSFVAVIAAVLLTAAERCGLTRFIPDGSPRAVPRNSATAFERTGGFALFGVSKKALRRVRLAWLPVAAVLALGLALASPAGLGLATIALGTGLTYQTSGLVTAVTVFIALSAFAACLIAPSPEHRGRAYTATLTTPQLLMDVYGAFRKWFPALSMLGTEFRGAPLKLNQKYIAHIASYGSASTYDATTGYANGANTARNGLVDVPVVVDQQPTYPLKWLHLDEIKDIKNKYEKVMEGAGYVLGKAAFDSGVAAKMTTRYFSQEVVTAVADCDYDWLQTLTTALNAKGVAPTGRVLIINSAVAAVLAVDPRMISTLYGGTIQDGSGYRQWYNKGGFALIQEYPDLGTNNATALTGVSGANAGDLMTKASHGLETGDPVTFVSGTTFTGLTAGTRYWAIKASSSTFQVATTYANAIAGTAVVMTADGTSGVFQLQENLQAFACDARAFSLMSGIPDGFNSQLAAQLGITPSMMFEGGPIDPQSGISMGVAKWMEIGTGNLFWCPTFVWGTNAGKQGDTAVAGNTAAANSILAAASLAGTSCDYAGLRCTLGAS